MSFPNLVGRPLVVVIIATKERPSLLERALASVASQTRPPDAIVIVEDCIEVSAEVQAVGARACASHDSILLGNRRTPGAAGAWNSGIDEVTRRFVPPDWIYVAILDDDDWWESEHIESCLARAIDGNLDMVAPGIVRHDDLRPDGWIQEPPPILEADVALVTNPHVQGSNLFVRLSTLLEAGMFDESLRSTTDRDLVVRLADLGAAYKPVPRATVHHDARGPRPRLSTEDSEAKAEGLARFWRKYRLRMHESQREAFVARARATFGVEVDSVALRPPVIRRSEPALPVPRCAKKPAALHLVVGIATDGDERGVARVSHLLDDLLSLQQDERIASLEVLLVENGNGGSAMRGAIDEFIGRGLRCYLADVPRHRADAASGLFDKGYARHDGRLGISEARELTQGYVRLLLGPGSIAWFLDDDKRLVPLVCEEDRLTRKDYDVVGAIQDLRAAGPDVVLGVDTGAAPLPVAATLRTQLVDLNANLTAMLALGPNARWPDRGSENIEHSRTARDFYYDLARPHTWHLELPFWFRAGGPSPSVRDAFVELCERAPRILAGEQVFRPLFVEASGALTLRPSVRRGGNTLVFDVKALADVPQVVPVADGRPSRRSDMVWAFLNARVRGRRVEEAPFPVFHDRSDLEANELDGSVLVDDIRGYALYSTLQDLGKRSAGLDSFDEDALFASERYRKYLVERVSALALSFYRARGAARTIRRLVASPEAWWHGDPEAAAQATRLIAFADRLIALLEPGFIDRVKTAVADTPPLAIADYLRTLHRKLDEAARAAPVKPEWFDEERVRLASARIERLASPSGALTLLGAGGEGVVFTDGREVFKYLDLWRTRASDTARAFLRGLVGAWEGTESLYPIHRLAEHGQDTILVYPYEPSEPYTGGQAAGIAQLLRECREHGIAFRNLHPRNLRVVGDRVRLVDYGLDLTALDATEWRHMIRRAWLCWRWAHHPDLDGLMRQALREEVPELTGWERLARAVDADDAIQALHDLTVRAVLEGAPGTVLDYGCGSGKLVRELVERKVRALGFDPRPARHWQCLASANFTSDRERALTSGPYDVVVCSLVLCTLETADYRRALTDLRVAIPAGGRAVISVCNPFHTHGGDTPFQRKVVEPSANSDTLFTWRKRLRSTGNERRDVHRPLHVLKRDLLRAGLLVESVTETSTVDLARLEPASDFMVLCARAVEPGPPVSLLVRASALEWRTLATQVRHVVEQLEGPHSFCERLVMLDSRRADLARQYDTPDYEAARAALVGLIADGTIDRFLEVPDEPGDVAELNERWFDCPAPSGHTAAGAPVAASLAGLEACSGEYVLHVDDDLLIARRDRTYDYLRDMTEALSRDSAALCASLNICHEVDQAWTSGDARGPWRVEARATLVHRARLLGSRPWPNELRDGVFVFSWHRALDQRIRARGLRSLRGGSVATCFIHPPNEAKRDRETWLAILDRVETGFVADVQRSRVELCGALDDWLAPKRREKLVVIACGRNVPAGRVARFRESLEQQTEREYGLLLVEDGGSRTSADTLRVQFESWPNVTLLTLRERRGALSNIVWALNYVCDAASSIIVLVDLDDALLGATALSRVAAEFEAGADLTVGSMLRTDKVRHYPVNFESPREHRGGNVWQHLRAFRRELFDRVPDDTLRLDGNYVDLAWDWAFMLALVDAARSPRHVDQPLYLHEPSGTGKIDDDRRVREQIIGRIVAKRKHHTGAER